MNYITFTERALQLIHEHGGYEGSLFYALRDLVDEHESTRFYRNHDPVLLSDMSELFRDPYTRELTQSEAFPTGYTAWDEFMGGLKPGWLYMITGKSDSGKSRLLFNLALQLSYNFARQRVMIFSLRTDPMALAHRMLKAIKARHPDEAVRYERDKFNGFDEYHPLLQSYKVYLQEFNARSVGALVDQIRRCHRELEIRFVFIDDPEEIFPDSPPHVMGYRRRWLYENLQELCRTLGVCIVMARRTDPTDFLPSAQSTNGLFELERRSYPVEDVDVVLQLSPRQDRPWFDPLRQLKILKHPREVRFEQFFLYQDASQEWVRDVEPGDFPPSHMKSYRFDSPGLGKFPNEPENWVPSDPPF
ncbi:MAG: DnaB-like helicase C-terminal domain-containing protein [Bacteroidota bacterium]